MRYFIKIVLITGVFSVSLIAYAESITDTYATGDTLTASTLNNIKSAVNDNDTRVSTLEAAPGSSLDLSGYGVPFSADGAPKNVVVLSQDLGGGNTRYLIRSRYANSTEQISIDGAPTIRPFIANSATVETDNLGNITSISNFMNTPDTANYVNYNIEESTYDINTLVKTVTDDTIREAFTCGGNTVQVCVGFGTLSANGNFSYIYDWSSIRALGGPYTFNDMTFNDVRMESYTGTVNQIRIRAKDIGLVFQDNGNGQRFIIYYQANGSSGGSLTGTPFDTGQPLDGLFF